IKKNAMIRKMLQLEADETECIILQLRKANMIPGDPERFLDGIGKWDKIVAFGSEKEFGKAYRTIQAEQFKLARKLQAAIEAKPPREAPVKAPVRPVEPSKAKIRPTAARIRIPKELNSLAAKARTFRKAVNFANAAKGKLSRAESEALKQTTQGDLKKFWEGVKDRDTLEQRSMIQHKSETDKLEDALKTEAMFNRADTELQRLNSGKARKAYQAVARALWDTSANIKRELLRTSGSLGKEAVIRHDLIKGATALSKHMINQAREKVFNGLSKAEGVTLDRIIQSRRTIAIDKYKAGMKHPEGLGLKEHQAFLDTIPKETFTRLNERANIFFKTMAEQVVKLERAGILSRESAALLLNRGDYSPRQFIQHIDPERTYTFGGKKITVQDSGIKALDEGSYRALNNNSRLFMAQVIARTQARIFRNEANKAMFDLAKESPNNGVVRLSKVVGKTKKGEPIMQEIPAGHEVVNVMIKGEAVDLIMPRDMAREWVTADPLINAQLANVIGWVGGAKVLKAMATGINPEFALTNMPRDIAHVWLTTKEYSPHLPVAAGQMAKDYLAVAKDTFTRRGRWLEFLNEGGGMDFLTHQGRITTKTSGVLSGFQKYLGYIGETSEAWTRLALRERAIINGKPNHEATWIARNYLDFSQGGSWIKAADSAVPYLNASVQGTRGIFRAAGEDPATFTYKVAEVGILSAGLYMANRNINQDCLNSISDAEKANNFIITTPLKYTDEEGNIRYLYFRIAKDQGQKIVSTLFENIAAKLSGDEIDIDQAVMAASEFISISPTERIPPSMDAAVGYLANKDFWRNKDIWPGPVVEPKEEFRPTTHPA
ncbi:hypothetical protein LCGC14_1880850, partial [marine sediment metagenome]